MFVLLWFILKHCKTGTDLAFIIEGVVQPPQNGEVKALSVSVP